MGHCARGSIGTPTRSSDDAACAVASAPTSDGNHAPAQLSQRPHGVAVSSSRERCRNCHAATGCPGRKVLVVEHVLLLGLALRGDVLVALAVVRPRLAGGTHPPCTFCTAPSTSSTFSSSSSGVRRMSTRASSAGVLERLVAELGEHRLRALLAGHRRRREVVPDRLVLDAGQQQHVGVLCRAAGTADLLVVRDGRGRRAEVQHEPEVGLVEAHAERARGDQRLDLVVLQRLLRVLRSAVSVWPV